MYNTPNFENIKNNGEVDEAELQNSPFAKIGVETRIPNYNMPAPVIYSEIPVHTP